jgi:hypothetical protein
LRCVCLRAPGELGVEITDLLPKIGHPRGEFLTVRSVLPVLRITR